MARKEIIPFGFNLNKLPPREDSLAIIPIEEPLSLVVIPPKQVAMVPPRRSYEQAYYAQFRQPTLPPPQDRLLLNDAPKVPKIAIPKDVKLLPPRSNEKLVGVKTNKLGEVTYIKYTTATPRVSLDGIRAAPGQVKFIPPRETPKRPTPPLEREEKRPRTTIAMLETRIDHISQIVNSLQQQNTLLIRTIDTLNKKIELETIERKKLEKQIKILSNYVGKKRES
jgi:hypothetical protein